MKPHEESATDTSDRRRNRRQAAHGHVRLFVETHELSGRAENVSQTGVLFFSQGELRVSVEIEENGGLKRVSGRLVRAQRMRDDNIAWAVEFDPS